MGLRAAGEHLLALVSGSARGRHAIDRDFLYFGVNPGGTFSPPAVALRHFAGEISPLPERHVLPRSEGTAPP